MPPVPMKATRSLSFTFVSCARETVDMTGGRASQVPARVLSMVRRVGCMKAIVMMVGLGATFVSEGGRSGCRVSPQHMEDSNASQVIASAVHGHFSGGGVW